VCRPFLEYENKWTIVLGLTSNNGSNDFQKLELKNSNHQYLYQSVLEKVASWGTTENLMFVVGATRASDIDAVRKVVPDHFLLVPGVGAQGGSLQEITAAAKNKDCGLLVNVSRAVIFAGDDENYASAVNAAAKTYHEEMRTYLP
jgi:orotidine-5'-phosphate decarboxylase